VVPIEVGRPPCHRPITVKEMVPIVIAAALWGSKWKGKTVRALCDNSAVVAIINQGSSRDQDIMHLRRCLAFLEAKFEFHICTSHIKVGDNTCADALSRNNLPLFTSLHTQASHATANSHPRAPSQPTNCVRTKLDVTTLDLAVDHYFLNGLAASTQKSYRSAKKALPSILPAQRLGSGSCF